MNDKCPRCNGNAGNNTFDRTICPCDDAMHTRCAECGHALDGCSFDDEDLARMNGPGSQERNPVLCRLQFWLQGWPNQQRPWIAHWVGNRISDLRYAWWRVNAGRNA